MTRRTIRELHELRDMVQAGPDLRDTVCQGFAVPAGTVPWETAQVAGLIMLGCTFEDPVELQQARDRGALLFPRLPDLPYDPYRSTLYRPEELLAGRDRHTLVAVMGGHELRRDDPRFAVVARTASTLTNDGRMILTGGGPGAMEAGNLGAYLSVLGDDAIAEAIATLARAPHYTDPGYVDAGRSVIDAVSDGAHSVAIPTWFYGHEPTNLFATWIAKFFSNSLREDRLLALATGGIIFAPGSAGTAQEVFQDGAQNHYETFGPPSPMVFLDRHHWGETGLYDALRRQAAGKPYAELLHLVDTPDEAAAALADPG